MSALGQKQTFRSAIAMSALPPKADIRERNLSVSTKRQLETSLSSQQQLHHLLHSGSLEQRAATGELDRYSRQ
jgi:hypothetical protein